MSSGAGGDGGGGWVLVSNTPINRFMVIRKLKLVKRLYLSVNT